MARKKVPCHFCAEEQIYVDFSEGGHQLSVEFYPEVRLLAVSSFAKDSAGETEEIKCDFRVKFCPECGRKLE